MAVQLNHHIVRVADKRVSAEYYADVLGLEPSKPFGPFLVLDLAGGLSLDFYDDDGAGTSQHYAFLVTEAEFDEILGRIKRYGATFYADPGGQQANVWNTHDGGRGLYWSDPDGHWLEIITRPYGSGS